MNTSQEEENSPPFATRPIEFLHSQYAEESESLHNKLPKPEFPLLPESNSNKVIPLQETNLSLETQSQLYTPNPIEIIWKNLIVDVSVEKKIVDPKTGRKKNVQERRRILHDLNGCIKPGEFTAILGPSVIFKATRFQKKYFQKISKRNNKIAKGLNEQQSLSFAEGCGKTTLLNFLSGRILGTNIEVSGKFILNGQEIEDIDEYSNQIAYVMQDDILMACFTPTEMRIILFKCLKEIFKLTADLRLRKLTEAQKVDRVNNLLKELGLTRCKNTKVGNSLIRGISGGERKRTSIGVELLTNPSMLFLDEPTTGLDSSTALQVMALLKVLSRRGVNVVSTIHQPSSEIFTNFEKLILICKGNIIYQGQSKESVGYFDKLGYKIPPFSNPSDYFMKLMNAEGLQVELAQKGQKSVSESEINQLFEERLKGFIQSYKESPMGLTPQASVQFILAKNDNSFNVGQLRQFVLLLKRSVLTQIRDPMDTLMKTVQLLIFAVMCMVSFRPLGDGLQGFQNRLGLVEFLESTLAYGAVQGAITTFSSERQIFVRERLSKSYEVAPYFWSKSLAELPFQLFYPIVLVSLVYHAIGLNNQSIEYFLICIVVMFGTYFSGTSMGLCMSVLIPKVDVAITLLPAIITPVQVLEGYFLNTNNVPSFLKWIEYISIFKYSFQAAALNEFDTFNYDIGEIDPIKTLGLKESMWESIAILFAIGIGFRVLCLIFLFLISTPSKPKLNQKKFKGI